MIPSNSVKAIVLTNIASSTLTSSYKPINASGLDQPCFTIRITNNSSNDVTISYDGINDNEIVLKSGGIFDSNSQTNSLPNNKVAMWNKGKVIYIKGTAGTGNIYLSGYYC